MQTSLLLDKQISRMYRTEPSDQAKTLATEANIQSIRKIELKPEKSDSELPRLQEASGDTD